MPGIAKHDNVPAKFGERAPSFGEYFRQKVLPTYMVARVEVVRMG